MVFMMGHSCKFDPDSQILHVQYAGVLSDRELLEGYLEDRGIIHELRPQKVVIDLSEVTAFTMSAQTNVQLADDLSFPQEVPLVFVAPCEVQFGIARMFEITANPLSHKEVKVVHTLTEA